MMMKLERYEQWKRRFEFLESKRIYPKPGKELLKSIRLIVKIKRIRNKAFWQADSEGYNEWVDKLYSLYKDIGMI